MEKPKISDKSSPFPFCWFHYFWTTAVAPNNTRDLHIWKCLLLRICSQEGLIFTSHSQREMKMTRYSQSVLAAQALRHKKRGLQAKLPSDVASCSVFLLLSLCSKSWLRCLFQVYQVSARRRVPSLLSSFSKYRIPGSCGAKRFRFLTLSRKPSPRFSGYKVLAHCKNSKYKVCCV